MNSVYLFACYFSWFGVCRVGCIVINIRIGLYFSYLKLLFECILCLDFRIICSVLRFGTFEGKFYVLLKLNELYRSVGMLSCNVDVS